MPQNLSEVYKQKLIVEKLKARDVDYRASFLLEAVSKEEIAQVAEISKELRSIVPKELPTLINAINASNRELLNALKGGVFKRVKDFLTPQFAKPISKSLAFLSGIRNAFSALPTILNTSLPVELQDKELRLSDILTNEENGKKLAASFQEAFLEALRPPSALSSLFGSVPFLDGKQATSLGEELLSLSVNELENLGQQIGTIEVPGLSNSDIQDLANQASKPSQEKEKPQTPQPTGAKKKIKTKEAFFDAFKSLSKEQKMDPEAVYQALMAQ